MMMSSTADAYRLFFALWPDQPLRDLIEERTRAIALASGGRCIAPCNYHITLLFLGNVGRAELEQAQVSAAALQSPAFELSLDRIESPRRAAVMWLGSEPPPAAFLALIQALRASNQAPRPDQPVRPHVTLVRDPVRRSPRLMIEPVTIEPVTIEPLMIEPVRWPARDFALVSSALDASGSQYTVLGRWPLQSVG